MPPLNLICICNSTQNAYFLKSKGELNLTSSISKTLDKVETWHFMGRWKFDRFIFIINQYVIIKLSENVRTGGSTHPYHVKFCENNFYLNYDVTQSQNYFTLNDTIVIRMKEESIHKNSG